MASKIVLAAAVAAAVVGAGGTALAVTGSDTTSGSASGTTSTAKHHGKHAQHGAKGLLRHTEHGVFVTKGKKGTVTHDLIHGSVTSVSASSITVKAADGTSMTFGVTKDTKVRQRTVAAKGSKTGSTTSGQKSGAHKPTASTISAVKTGDDVFVVGTGSSTKTARAVVDIKK